MMQLAGKLWKRVVGCFLAGVFAVLPLVITVGIVIWVASFIEQFLGPETFFGSRVSRLGFNITHEGGATGEPGPLAYFLGWAVVLFVVFLLGVLLELGAKRFFSQLMTRFVQGIPVIGSVYETSKQIIDMLDKKKDDTDLKGMSPVACHFGSDRGAAVLALLASPQRVTVAQREYQIVIIPTAPVPFGGALVLVPSASITPLEMSVDGLMNVYVSMGVTANQFLPSEKA